MLLVTVMLAMLAPEAGASRPLTEPELSKVLPDSVIQEIVPYELQTTSTSEQFNRYGTYVLHGQNLETEGRYHIEGDKFCTTIAGKEKACRYLLLDPRGYYWVSKSKSPTDFRLVSITALPQRPESGPYAGRDGAAEARADIRKRRPLKLYTHGAEGEFPGYITPGLIGCDPDRNNGSKQADKLFLVLPFTIREDRIPSEDESRQGASAVAFAEAYNTTMFRKRKAEVLKICPAATFYNADER